jgi:RimJ/RimL family protein N-acetyltransferase
VLAERARGTLQYHWSKWASWQPSDWRLDLVVVLAGAIVGTQGMGARDFATVREVTTGSWLGQAYHRRGIGTEMRAAVLHLAFEGLGAEYATSVAHAGNLASLGVSRKLGYGDDGVERYQVRGGAVTGRRLRIGRAAWQARRPVPVEISGLEPCLPCFGLPG